MPLLDQLNLNHFRIFECVCRHRNMTTAAKELHLTQSGISQHMKALEISLGLQLFDKVKQRLVPTAAAGILFEICEKGFNQLEATLWALTGKHQEVEGSVSIGIPPQFAYHIVLPELIKFSKKYPKIQFHVRIGLAPMMNELLLTGELDLAFVDDVPMDRSIHLEKVYDEIFELAIAPSLLKTKGTPQHKRQYYESLDYVAYVEETPFLRSWFDHHLSRQKLHFNIKAYVMDVEAASRLITGGLGAGVLPSYFIKGLAKAGHKLYCFPGSRRPLKNTISIAYLAGRTQSVPALTVLDFVKASLRRNR